MRAGRRLLAALILAAALGTAIGLAVLGCIAANGTKLHTP